MLLNVKLDDLKNNKGKKDIPLKAQIITDEKNLKILNVSFSSGKTYNFKLFKYSKIHFLENALIIADSGYLGINSLMLKKSFKKYKLIKEEDEKAYEGVQNISNLIISEYQQGWQSWR